MAASGHAGVNRRRVIQTVAWAAPAIVIAVAVPAAAASNSAARVVVTSASAARSAIESNTLLSVTASIQVLDGTVTTPEMRVLVPWNETSPPVNPTLRTSGWIFANAGSETVNAKNYQVFRIRYAGARSFGADAVLGPVEFSVEVTEAVVDWKNYLTIRARAYDATFSQWRASSKKLTPA